MKGKLPTDYELTQLLKHANENKNETVAVMAAELLEYRMNYGPLGCEWLDTESEAFTKLVDYK